MDRSIIHILAVDDQLIVQEAMKRLISVDSNLALHFCIDPLQAVSLAHSIKPTIILLDLMMPEIDGMLLLKYLKDDPEIKDIPVIVLSVKEEAEIKAQAFTLGAVDFMVTFPAPIEFCARIHYHVNNFLSKQYLQNSAAEMSKSSERLERELKEAADYLQARLPEPISGPVLCSWRYIPSVSIGGDLFGYRWIDSDHFVFFLFDITGHGVRASLYSTSLFYAIQKLQDSGVDIRQPHKVLERLNGDFQMEQHDHIFFTMWYGVYQKSTRRLTYASGGHPPAIARIPGVAKEELLYTHGMALGVDAHSTYEAFSLELAPHSRLYLFSDGIFEVASLTNERMTFDHFVRIVMQPSFPGVSDLDRIIHNIEIFQEKKLFEDDVCLLQFDFS